jgi:hypothetical protein
MPPNGSSAISMTWPILEFASRLRQEPDEFLPARVS